MRKVSGDGDTWLVTSDGYDERRGVRTVVFHCLSNSQRPYRVVEIPEPLLGNRTVDDIGDSELGDLFKRSQVLDFSHDRSAMPASHGHADPAQA
jgi:hypothetical protein